jgi:sortase B
MYLNKIGRGGSTLIKDRIYSIIQTILIGLFAYATINIIGIAIHYNEGNKIYDESQEKYFSVRQKNTRDSNSEKFEVDIEQLQKINPSIVGWIYIKDSNVSYPLLHHTDNEKYLKKTYDNRTSNFGSIFIDFRNDPNLFDSNSIIYGHNTKNGSMFGSLKKYKDSNYFYSHPKIHIIYGDKVFEYEIFSVYTTLDSGPAYVIDFSNDDEFQNFLTAITSLSVIKTDIKPDVGDKIITLSTCTSRTEDERFVVHASLANVITYDENLTIE